MNSKVNNENKDFSQIPAGACTLVVGEFELGNNGEGAKSAPIKLVARSGKAIEHWYWGSVVHDMAGMHVHKSRIPIDYVHDSKEVIGYLNRFDTQSGDLVTTGALVPFKETDRATEIIHKMAAGVPYEASINFGGDGIKIEEIAEGQVAPVNGFQFEGPGIIIREWPLRGVAICPYGADMNTESSVLGNSNKVFAAAVVKAVPEAPTKETQEMSKSVDVAAQVETPAAVEVKVEVTPVEVKPVEMAAQPAKAEVAPVVEAVKTEGAPVVVLAESKPISREEFTKIADKFGAEIAAQIVRDGGDYHAALELAYAKIKTEVDALRMGAAENANKSGQPIPVTVAKDKKKLFNTGK